MLRYSGKLGKKEEREAGGEHQAFARVGRAKLREQVHRRDELTADFAFLADGRVNLWKRYVEYVRATRPIALLMENVPDILNHGHNNVAELVAKSLAEEGYEVRYTLLNASWYGTPQTRERMILIGYHKDTGLVPEFPVPTHHGDTPALTNPQKEEASPPPGLCLIASPRWLRRTPITKAPPRTPTRLILTFIQRKLMGIDIASGALSA